MRGLAAFLCVTAMLAVAPGRAAEVHGQTDVFTAPGVTLAWAILRGADEARTAVVVRVVTEPGIRALTVVGRDPFTKAEKTLVAARPTGGCLEIRIPRESFADFPRTEWHLTGSEKEPRLVVFYLGVPDTTPELVDEPRLEAYLGERAPKAKNTTCPRT